MQVDTSGWSGDGEFTRVLIEALQQLDDVVLVRVEDAPSSRAESDYHFIANEIYVGFRTEIRREGARRVLFWSTTRRVEVPALTLAGLEDRLSALEGIGAPDYSDAGMLQYLRTERIIPPYQTRGYKLVELVRLYEVGHGPREPSA
jgi:hypothetical protein